MHLILGILAEAWNIFLQSAFFMLFGFGCAALLYAFVKTEKIAKYLGTGKIRSVLLAAVAGIPLPLCSCGVVPAAAALKKQGASKGATLSFLISTPETGVDSIPITYALLDPLIALIRPVAAFIAAALAGIAENFYGEKARPPALTPTLSACGCGCCAAPSEPLQISGKRLSAASRVAAGLKYAFVELMGDIGPWFVFGVLLAGLISYLVPDRFAEAYLGNPLLAMPVMLLAGIPMYVCATSSTPIAAALVLKGLSPGAALVFLLAGPATNVASMSMVARLLGKRSLFIYLAAISSSALVLGFLTDLVYFRLGISAGAAAGQAAELLPFPVELAAALLLAVLIGFSKIKGAGKSDECSCSSASA